MARVINSPLMGESNLHPKLERFIVAAMTVAAFGPYLIGGVRTEQAMVYVLAVAAVTLRLAFIRASGGLKFLIPWALMLLISLLGVLFPLRRNAPWDGGGTVAGLDNLLLPVAVMLAIWCTIRPTNSPGLLQTVLKVIVWGMSLNAILAIIDTRADLSPLLRSFWSKEELMSTTAERAATMGRVSGIFNQPAEAGIAYGLAGLAAVYLYQRSPQKLTLALLLIGIGGLLTVSKIFVIGGVLLILIYMLRTRSVSGKLAFFLTALLAVGAVGQSGLLEDWAGSAAVTRLLNPPETAGLIEYYSANRWESGSDMLTVISTALAFSPLVGIGAGGWEVAYDSSWTQAIVVSGLIGAVCVALVFLGFFVLARTTADPKRRQFTYYVAVLMLGASFGIPSLSANRVATLIWVITALLVLAHREVGEDTTTLQQRQESPERHTTGRLRSGSRGTGR